jgi:hypothetical protein
MMTVTVPDGVYAGDAMNIMVGEQEFTITVPDGVGPGMNIEVDLPVDDAGGPSDGPPPPQQVEIIVPDGCWPGMEFTVEFEGRSFNIVVPDGCEPGMALNVEVPAGEEEPPPPPPPPPATTPWELVGRRAALCGLIAKAILNGRKGTVKSYNPDKDRLVVTIDGMHPDVMVAFRNLKELPPDDAIMHLPETEPPEAPPAGVHYVGDRVKVERSNGSISYATIVEYDEVMEVYTVDVGNGILKYGVEESYITHVDHTGEWAGKHFIGRKVRVPDMGGRDIDKNGIIRGHSEAMDTYTVSFENGKILGGLSFEQIKVPYELIKK